jgi:AcrR family transcriptional regulator
MLARSEVRVPKQRRAVRTRAAIMGAARVEFSQRGYAGATSKTIAERAGVSVGSLYQYFSDKDQILRELAQERSELIAGRTLALLGGEGGGEQSLSPLVVAETPDILSELRERLRSVLDVVIEQHRDDPGLHAVLTERRHVDSELDALTLRFERGLVEAGADLLRSWGHEGDVLATSFILFSMIEGAVHSHVLGSPVVSDERLHDALLCALVKVALPTSKGS